VFENAYLFISTVLRIFSVYWVRVMKAFIVQFPFGLVVCDETNSIVGKALFPRKVQVAARKIMRVEDGRVTDEISGLISSLQSAGYDIFVFENSGLAHEVEEQLHVIVEVSKPSVAGDFLRSRVEQVAVETGFVKDVEELRIWNHDVSMEIAKLRIKGAVERRDLVVAQAIQTLDDLDRTLNLFMGRLREWYSVHFPELDRLVEKHETYARLVLKLGNRENFSLEALKKEDIPEARSEQIFTVAETSMGADISSGDLAQIVTLSKDVLELYELRKSMENYLDKSMDEIAPNTKTIVGSLLGARLIAIAGGLQNLALRPSSTIQVLGAEKALFRSLKTGARPPKHGLIFQHTLLHEAKRWQRGKIARAVAGKVAIAARIDAFGGKYAGDRLKADLDKRVAEIREKYKEPPPIKERKMPERRPGPERRWREDRPRDNRPRDNRPRDNRPRDGGPRDGGRRDNKWRKKSRAD
jgi:nucleolar protein 56